MQEGRNLAAMRPGETRVPMPNTRVKARAADGTMLETAWKSRRLPDYLKKQPKGFYIEYWFLPVIRGQNIILISND